MDIFPLMARLGDRWMSLRSIIVDPFSPPKKIIVRDGVRFNVRRGTSDTYVINEVFRHKVYGAPPHGIIVDIGANIGAFSLFAARTADTIFSFEPESSNHSQLLKNIALNQYRNIMPFKKAVGGKVGTVTLHRAASNLGASSVVHQVSNDVETVEMITLDSVFRLCNIERINFLKIDIEGSEYELFENASLEALGKIDMIVMETHPVHGRNVGDIRCKLESAGFKVNVRFSHLSLFGLRVLFANRTTTP